MAKPTWICAGCDGRFEVRKIDTLRVIHVEISAVHGSKRLSETFELCPDCQNRIVAVADPRNWPRQSMALAGESGVSAGPPDASGADRATKLGRVKIGAFG
jgi:hypothetical protein